MHVCCRPKKFSEFSSEFFLTVNAAVCFIFNFFLFFCSAGKHSKRTILDELTEQIDKIIHFSIHFIYVLHKTKPPSKMSRNHSKIVLNSQNIILQRSRNKEDLDVDVAGILVEHFEYSTDNSTALKREVLNLLNHPTAIQPKATLVAEENLKFEVASPSAKNGSVLVTVYSSHAGCVCGRFRHDSICKHSIAVAAVLIDLFSPVTSISWKRSQTKGVALPLQSRM